MDLSEALRQLPSDPRVVISGNHSTPWHTLGLLDAALPSYRSWALDGQRGLPDREGVLLETSSSARGCVTVQRSRPDREQPGHGQREHRSPQVDLFEQANASRIRARIHSGFGGQIDEQVTSFQMSAVIEQGVVTDASVATDITSSLLDKAIATLRIAFGITFLWAFLDKLLALGFHTGYDQEGNLDRFGDAAWIDGGSPTEGFLSFGVPVNNPFKDVFTATAGQGWVDWLFMIGLLGIGVALLSGVAMRIGTAAGALMYALMYVAVLPLENNPIVDNHLIGIMVMAVLALAHAGRTWGLGRRWESQDLVRENPALR